MQRGQPKRGAIVVEGPVDYAALAQWGLDAEFALLALLGTAHAKAIPRLAALGAGRRVCSPWTRTGPARTRRCG